MDGRIGSRDELERYPAMPQTIDDLQRAMAAAAAALDFEQARALRDRIALIRGGADRDTADRTDTSGLARQQPGAMGLGTSQGRPERPAGWTPPRKPDPMTAGRGNRQGK